MLREKEKGNFTNNTYSGRILIENKTTTKSRCPNFQRNLQSSGDPHTDGEDSENFEEDKVRNWDKDVENVAEKKRRKEGDERIWREDT